MEPGGFKIKRVGEDLPSNNETEQNNEAVVESEEVLEQSTISPPPQAKSPLRLANRPGTRPPVNNITGMSCPECNVPIDDNAVMCVSCGYNIKKGRKVNTKYEQPKRHVSNFPNQHRSTSRKSTKPSALSNLLFLLIFFGGIGAGVWFLFFKPLPPIYGPFDSVDLKGAKLDAASYTIVAEYLNKKGSYSITAWREMEAHHDGKELFFKAKKNGKEFKNPKWLLFKKPKGVSPGKMKVVLDQKDYDYLNKTFGGQGPFKEITSQKAKPKLDNSSPESVARIYMIAMSAKDGKDIQKVIVPNPNAKILWEGQSPRDAKHLYDLDFIDLEVGAELIASNNKAVKITPDLVSDKKKILQPILAGQIIPIPIVMVKIQSVWKVNASDIIGAKMRLKAKADGQVSGSFTKGSPKEVAYKFLIASANQDKKGVIDSIIPGMENELLWDDKAPEKLLKVLHTVIFKTAQAGDLIYDTPTSKITVKKEMLEKDRTLLIPVINGNDFPMAFHLKKTAVGWRVDPTSLIRFELEGEKKK